MINGCLYYTLGFEKETTFEALHKFSFFINNKNNNLSLNICLSFVLIRNTFENWFDGKFQKMTTHKK